MSEKTNERGKLEEAIRNLDHALDFLDQVQEDHFYFSGITKSFEVCLEYAWKYMKRREVDEGLEVYSPKDVIKQAGKIGLIDDVERWLDFLTDRNLAVHDYLGVSDEEYLKTIQSFLVEVKKLV